MPFFNKIRKDLIPADGLRRYLLYAIGEIALVVIGILIALSLNRWDLEQSERNQEIISLKYLSKDLQEQSVVLKDYIKTEDQFYLDGQDILIHFSNNKGFYNMETVYPKLNGLIMRKTFNPINTTFKELISTGGIRQIQNDSLKYAIMRYNNNLERINMIVSNNNARLVDGLYNPTVHRQSVLSPGHIPGLGIDLHLIDSTSLITLKKTSSNLLSNPEKSLELFNVLSERINIALIHKQFYEQIEKETDAIFIAIQAELRKKER